MNYIITEDEYNKLDAVRGQLSLICGLLSAKGADSNLFDASDLYDFMGAQADTLTAVKDTIYDRYEAAKNPENVLSTWDWVNIIHVVSGRRSLTGGDLRKIGIKLENCVKADPDMELIRRTWIDVMTMGGELPYSLEPRSTDGFHVSFERLVPVVQEPELEPAH